VHENQVVFATGDALADDAPHRRPVPELQAARARDVRARGALPREELLDVVRRVSVMAQRNSPLRLRFADGELTVSAQTQDVGEARESLPVASRRSRSRSASTPSSCATGSSRSLGEQCG
jgi:DNA polymerase-3 subunit beta